MTEEHAYISILGKDISYAEERRDIFQLNYYEKNPRVLSKLVGDDALNGSFEEKQQAIEEGMREEASVKALLSSIPKQGGISDPLIIKPNGRVLEGNSRLASLRILYEKKEEEKYLTAPCRVIDLNEKEIDAFLHQQHIDGKTPWSAYDKAYSAYHRVQIDRVSLATYARRTSSSKSEIEKQINAIKLMMLEKMSHKKDRFSYYDLFHRSRKLKKCFEENPDLKKYVLAKLKQEKIPFEAVELRDDVPEIAKHRTLLSELIKETTTFITLKERARNARVNGYDGENLVNSAIRELKKIEASAIEQLADNRLGSFEEALNKCIRETDRIQELIERVKS